MRKIYILLTICCALIACKKNDIEFSYSPSAPRAGQEVIFSNLSTAGEEWSWTFGDGAVSTLKNPTHTYKKPGKYVVTLKVDNKNTLKIAKEITIADTVPSFSCADSVFYIFEEYTFTAEVYNPYNYDVKYLWDIYTVPMDTWETMPQSTLIDGDSTGSTLKVSFLLPTLYYVGLRVILNEDTTYVQKELFACDRSTNAVLIRTAEADYRQRIFGKRAEEPQVALDEQAVELLDEEQDTAQLYNGYLFTLSELATVFDNIEGFHIANRKLYYRANGLWIANIDGSNRVQIDDDACPAMTLDLTDSRIYWANSEGVWYMPFIGSDNNQFVTEPVQLNSLTGVTKLASEEQTED